MRIFHAFCILQLVAEGWWKEGENRTCVNQYCKTLKPSVPLADCSAGKKRQKMSRLNLASLGLRQLATRCETPRSPVDSNLPATMDFQRSFRMYFEGNTDTYQHTTPAPLTKCTPPFHAGYTFLGHALAVRAFASH